MGGGIIRLAVERPVTVSVGVILVVLFGVLSVSGLPIQLTPDITVPTVNVSTVWPGATPTEVEAEILEEQEEALKSLPGLERMTSEARRGSGSVNLELAVGTSLDEALVRVSNLLSQVPDYPQNARQPVITTSNASGPPMAVAVIQSEPPGRPVAEYRTWAEEVIIPRMERIPGIASIRMLGGQEQEVHIDFDPSALAARGIPVSRIVQAVRAELADVSAGDIPMGKRRYVVRTQVTPTVVEELENVVLATSREGTPVRLGDVAKVRPGLRKPDAVSIVNGSPSLTLLFFRESGSNVLEVTEELRRVVAQLQDEYMASEGLSLRIISDQTDYINGALDLVRSNIIMGALLAIGVLLLFLRSIGASLVVAVSIPVSIIGTILVMSLAGRTINIVSLAGMAFAVGMVVDNSIVVLENIDTWRRRERDISMAAIMGTREVWGALVASTATTAAVFLPIIGWQDEVGELLRDVSVAIATAVIASLVVSVLVIPSLSARILKSRAATASIDPDESFTGIGRTVRWIVSKPLRSLAVAALGISAAVLVAVKLLPPLEYLPAGNRNLVFGFVIPPPGYSVDEMQAIGQRVQDGMVPHIGVEKDGIPSIQRTFFAGSPESAFFGGVSDDPNRVNVMAEYMRKLLRQIPDIIGVANQASLFGGRGGGTRAIEIDISGSNLGVMTEVGGRMMGALRTVMPTAQVRPVPSLDLGAPELRVEPLRAQASQLGVSSSDLGLLMDAYVDGAIIGELGKEGEPKRDVVLQAVGVDVGSPEALRAAPVATPAGRTVPVGEIANVEETLGPTVIQRIERRRAITLQVTPPDDVALEEALDLIKNQVVGKLAAEGAIPPEIRIDYEGTASKLDSAKERMGFVLLLAVAITFLLLAALYEDFLAPLAILVTVPLAGAGGILGLRAVDTFLGNQPMDMLTAVGFVILIGVVVNNAILIVDGALARMREQGAHLNEAIAYSVRGRIRPILMTVMTSLAGLLPLVLFPGYGSELYRGVGGIVLGGLAVSTVLTLFMTPAVFSLIWRLRGLVARVLGRPAPLGLAAAGAGTAAAAMAAPPPPPEAADAAE